MISYLVGKIEEKTESTLVMEVNGIGYELSISSNTYSALPLAGETCKVLTYLQVKEDGICLFGFATAEEKSMFLQLITVSGIGPKSAVTVLSGLRLSDLIVAIVSGDVNLLAKIKGLGRKSAERICLELKDKISGISSGVGQTIDISETYDEGVLNDAIQTLISLGVNKNEAFSLARSKMTEGCTAEEVIMRVLKEYGR